MRGLQVDALVARVGGHDHLEPAGHELLLDRGAFGVVLGSGVLLGGELLLAEHRDEPFGGVRVLGEHHKLTARCRVDPVRLEAPHHRIPLGDFRTLERIRGLVGAHQRLKLGEEPVYGFSFRLRVERAGFHDSRLAVVVVLVDVVADCEPVGCAHLERSPAKRLSQRVQRRSCALAVHHRCQGASPHVEVLVHQPLRPLIELLLAGVHLHLDVVGLAWVEQRAVGVVVDEFLLHAPQEVQRPRRQRRRAGDGVSPAAALRPAAV